MPADEANIEEVLRLVEETSCDLWRLGSVLNPVQCSAGCICRLIGLFDRYNLIVNQLLIVIFWRLFTSTSFLRHAELTLASPVSTGVVAKWLGNDLLDDRQSFLSIVKFRPKLGGFHGQLGGLVALRQELVGFRFCQIVVFLANASQSFFYLNLAVIMVRMTGNRIESR